MPNVKGWKMTDLERMELALLRIRDWTKKQPDTIWYDEITTLHDLCEQALMRPSKAAHFVLRDWR